MSKVQSTAKNVILHYVYNALKKLVNWDKLVLKDVKEAMHFNINESIIKSSK